MRCACSKNNGSSPNFNWYQQFWSFQAFADKAHADGKKSVVFVGENHEDPGAHKIELDLAKKLLCQEVLIFSSVQHLSIENWWKITNSNWEVAKIEMHSMSICLLDEYKYVRLWSLQNGSTGRNLSLEFYERDIQPVMDEYLSGSIDYQTFLHDSRPPANHEDYKPLLEFCKGAGVPVVASNCARR